jgi:hypothetical protein
MKTQQSRQSSRQPLFEAYEQKQQSDIQHEDDDE